MSKWTLFWDMHSGGGCKEKPYEKIYIEADRDEAEIVFQNKFGHNPNRVTCTCCGPDYSIESGELNQISAYHRNASFDKETKKWVEAASPESWRGEKCLPVEEYAKSPGVLLIRENEIQPEWRVGHLKQQGYVWVGE